MIDYLCDNIGDLIIANGDFLKGSSEQKHVDVLMHSRPGSLRRYQLVGVGAIDYVKAPANKLPALQKNILLQLESIGFNSPGVIINPDRTIDFEL